MFLWKFCWLSPDYKADIFKKSNKSAAELLGFKFIDAVRVNRRIYVEVVYARLSLT
jgi:hypothetical protein